MTSVGADEGSDFSCWAESVAAVKELSGNCCGRLRGLAPKRLGDPFFLIQFESLTCRVGGVCRPLLVPSSLFLQPRLDSDDSCIAIGRKVGSGLFCCVPELRVSVVREVMSELPSAVSSSFPITGIVAGNKRISDRLDCA